MQRLGKASLGKLSHPVRPPDGWPCWLMPWLHRALYTLGSHPCVGGARGGHVRLGGATHRGIVFTRPENILEYDIPEVCLEFLFKKNVSLYAPHIPTIFPISPPYFVHTRSHRAHFTQHDHMHVYFNKDSFLVYISIYSANFIETCFCIVDCARNQGCRHS